MGRNQQGSGNKGHDFLRAIAGFAEANASPSSSNKPVKLGRVDYEFNPEDFLGGVNPRILFDGESSMSEKRYAVMPPYYPLPGARVCLIPVGTTYLIIGAVENVPQDPEVQIFTATDTWEKPAGARLIKVECQGGGAGGGGTPAGATGSSAAGGGGGGAYTMSHLSANVVGSTETVTVGAGGGGGAAGANAGSAGGTTTFGSLVSAGGGNGGSAGFARTTGSNISTGGLGGTGTTGDFLVPGGDGGNGVIITNLCIATAWGGGSYLCGMRRGSGFITGQGGGTNGRTYGGGGGGAVSGSGGTSAQAGGDGAAGVVIVTAYF